MSRSIRILCCSLLLAVVPGGAWAIGSVDQESLGMSMPATIAVHSAVDVAQSATIGSRGELGSLELAIGKSASTPDAAELVVELRPAYSGGIPGVPSEIDDRLLATFTVFASELPTAPTVATLYEIDFSPLHLGLNAGQRIAIVLRSSVAAPDAFLFAGDLAGGYPGGSAFTRGPSWQPTPNSFDAGFRTFMVPEPHGAAAAALLTLAVLGRTRRERPTR